MTVKSYKDLIVWQKAVDLAIMIYSHTKGFPKDETYGIRQQMRRAGVSVASNIAEGQCRGTTKDFLYFLSIALGSLAELETQILIADRLSYFENSQALDLGTLASEVGRLLNGLKRSLVPADR